MPERIRTFVAVPIEAPRALRAVMQRLSAIDAPVRVIDDLQLHLTLSFLGETHWQQVSQIDLALQRCIPAQKAFDIELTGLGAFPDSRRPRVVWAGIEPPDSMCDLAEHVAVALERVGFPREDRPFHPHLTIARVKGRTRSEIADVIQQSHGVSFGLVHVRDVIFYQSELGRAGPVYTPLSQYELADP